MGRWALSTLSRATCSLARDRGNEFKAPANVEDSTSVASLAQREGGFTMHTSGDHDLPSWDAEGGGDPEEDPGEELEAMIEHADRPFAAESFGTTAEEEEEGESLDEQLSQERRDRPTSEVQLAIEDDAAPDDEGELVGEASLQNDPFVSPEEAAMTIRDRAPGAVDHPDER